MYNKNCNSSYFADKIAKSHLYMTDIQNSEIQTCMLQKANEW